MNISFDFDSTLIPNGKEFEVGKQNSITKLFGIEETMNHKLNSHEIQQSS